MTETNETVAWLWRLVRPSLHRLYVLLLGAPGVWVIYWATGRDWGAVLLIAMALVWIAFIFRTWFWYERPRL